MPTYLSDIIVNCFGIPIEMACFVQAREHRIGVNDIQWGLWHDNQMKSLVNFGMDGDLNNFVTAKLFCP